VRCLSAKHFEVNLLVGVGRKDVLAIVAALSNVVRDADRDHSTQATELEATRMPLLKTGSFADTSGVFEAGVSPVTTPTREQNQQHARKISRNPWEPVVASNQKGELTQACARGAPVTRRRTTKRAKRTQFVLCFQQRRGKTNPIPEGRPAATSPIAPPPWAPPRRSILAYPSPTAERTNRAVRPRKHET
jgi:hypothetical protein